MTVTFFFNYLNHHQVCIADEMYRILGDGFKFVATLPRNGQELKGGKDCSSRPYCLLAAEKRENQVEAMQLALTSDVCVFGACSQEYAVHRAVHNPSGLAFEVGERWLKRGWLNVLSPVLRTWWLNYHRYYMKANFHKLCSSAFAACDDECLGCYVGRHYKWGYFTEPLAVSSERRPVVPSQPVRLLWCARFIGWKHPELAVNCALHLKRHGYRFTLDMYGDGVLRPQMEKLVKQWRLEGEVTFHGNVDNDTVQHAMRMSDIFLFTSDRQEGWGVVANEAMAAGCCVVAGDKIGAAPYLINHGVNGYLFPDKDAHALFAIVQRLCDNPAERLRLAMQAQADISNVWSPQRAAQNLLQLIQDLQNGRASSIVEGPCSNASSLPKNICSECRRR